MGDFIMSTGESIKLSGSQKAAILLAELGDFSANKDAADLILENLNLTTEQKRRIRVSMENLGDYNPHDKRQAQRENVVLEELIAYGQAKGIFTPFHVDPQNPLAKKEQSISKMAMENPDAIAKILGTWLDGE